IIIPFHRTRQQHRRLFLARTWNGEQPRREMRGKQGSPSVSTSDAPSKSQCHSFSLTKHLRKEFESKQTVGASAGADLPNKGQKHGQKKIVIRKSQGTS